MRPPYLKLFPSLCLIFPQYVVIFVGLLHLGWNTFNSFLLVSLQPQFNKGFNMLGWKKLLPPISIGGFRTSFSEYWKDYITDFVNLFNIADRGSEFSFSKMFILQILRFDISISIRPGTTKFGQQLHLDELTHLTLIKQLSVVSSL